MPPALAARLAKLDIRSERDLALHLPLRYEDETRVVAIRQAPAGPPVQVEGVVETCQIMPRPRRQFVAQGFMSGAATVLAPSIFGMFANPRAAHAALSPDLETLKQACGIAVQGAGKIPFICIDLAGGANMVGSNVLVGQQGGQ